MVSQVFASVLLASTVAVHAVELNVNSASSIKGAASTIAAGMMSQYHNNQSSTSAADVGTLGKPYYWWESAAVWGGLISYWAYTNDTTYNPTVTQALLAQVGEENNYMPASQTKTLGNDDQAFWALACMDALELGFAAAPSGGPQWLQLAETVWNLQAARWDTTTCSGGLRWQIFQFNVGYDYKNSISTAALFQLSARLARYTGNSTYSDWATKSYNWLESVKLVDSNYNVFDGTDDLTGCTQIDHVTWTYANAAVLYGAAVMYNNTNGSSIWQGRVTGLLSSSDLFFNASSNATKVLTEIACESAMPINCNTDQLAFKGIFSRWYARSILLAPFAREHTYSRLASSAQAAAKACPQTSNGTACAISWVNPESTSTTGVGEHLSALDTIQSLLLYNSSIKLFRAGDVTPVTTANGTTSSNTTTGTGTSGSVTPSGSHGAASIVDIRSSLWHGATIAMVSALFSSML